MGIDHLIQLNCEVRGSLAGDDLESGSRQIMAAVKAAEHASMARKTAPQRGIPVEMLKVRWVKFLPTGPVEAVVITVAELERQATVLAPHIAKCQGCPANVVGGAFGCYDSISYPISAAVEEWMMDRVQAPDTVGGRLFHKAIADFGYGSKVRSYRQRKLFEAPEPPSRSWKTGWFSSKKLNADQLWHAMLAVGPISPSHGLMVLLALGAIEISGRIPTRPSSDASLVSDVIMSPAMRPKMTKVLLDPSESHGIRGLAEFQAFLNAMYVAWVHEAVLFVDA